MNRKSVPIRLLLLALATCALSHPALAQNVQTTDPRIPTETGARALFANQYPNTDGQGNPDVGARINAADAALGTNKGTIYYLGGGNIATQIVLNSNHSLRLGAGTYTANTTGAPILMKSDTSLSGDGFQTILQETTGPAASGGEFNVIANADSYASNGSTERNLTIRDLQIAGARSTFDSIHQTISLGNVHGCLVDDVFLNATHAIGIQAGGASTLGNDTLGLGRYAEHVVIRNCQFYKVGSQNLAVVNGKNIILEGNIFRDPSQTGGVGCTAIDLEVNDLGNDYMENILVVNNTLDARNAALVPHGNFIAYQPGTAHTGPARISGNMAVSDFRTSNGVVLTSNATDVEISGNYLNGMGQKGLDLLGTRIRAFNNILKNTGTGGSDSLHVESMTDSRIYGNDLFSPVLGNDMIVEGAGCSGNLFYGNTSKGVALSSGRQWANINYSSGLFLLDDFTGAQHNHTNAAGGGQLAEGALSLSDVLTNNVSTARHGFVPKAPNDLAVFLRGDGTWAIPTGGGSSVTPSGWTDDGSVVRLTTATDKVGIGTSAPNMNLEVAGSAPALFVGTSSATNPDANVTSRILLGSTSSVAPGLFTFVSNDTLSGDGIGAMQWANYALTGTEKRLGSIGLSLDGASNSGALQFYTASAGTLAERMRLSASGNLGIGTTAPTARLQVTGGDIYATTVGSGLILKSPNGSCFRITVSDAGALSTTSVTCP